jgi:uncharacterized membrane protein YsdA (DUF1294 family)
VEFSTQEIALFVAIGLGVVNIGSVVAVWWDKRRAVNDQWRIKEETPLVWALVGGWPGGIWAMRRFRHKTTKKSFIAKYVAAVTLNLAAISAIAFAVITTLM